MGPVFFLKKNQIITGPHCSIGQIVAENPTNNEPKANTYTICFEASNGGADLGGSNQIRLASGSSLKKIFEAHMSPSSPWDPSTQGYMHV